MGCILNNVYLEILPRVVWSLIRVKITMTARSHNNDRHIGSFKGHIPLVILNSTFRGS